MRSRTALSLTTTIALTALTWLGCGEPTPQTLDAGDEGTDAGWANDAGRADAASPADPDAGPTLPPPPCDEVSPTTARASEDDGNIASNALDDDLETRWSAPIGAWIELELPEVATLSGLSVAWYRGDERRNAFSVELSTDGATYREVFRGWSSGHTREAERYGFGRDDDALFVRITVHDNTQNGWASIVELRVHGPGCDAWMQDIFLLIGQSNMAGRAPIEAQDRDAPDGAFVLDEDGHWTPASNRPLGLNRYSTVEEAEERTRLGPAYTFGEVLARDTGRRIGLVVNARGGTRVRQWLPEDHEGEFPLYDEAVRRARLALMNNPGATLRAVLWHQGEGDNNARAPEYYVASIEQIVTALRDDLDAPEALFVAGEVGTWQGRGRYVNEEIRRIPDVILHAAWVSSEDLTTHETDRDPWGPHFDSRSQRILGERYAHAVLERLYGP